MPDSKQKTWIILASDGRHVTVGRATDPTDAEMDAAAAGLKQLGLGGWLAVLEGRYHSRDKLALLMVRELAPADQTFTRASEIFHGIRKNG